MRQNCTPVQVEDTVPLAIQIAEPIPAAGLPIKRNKRKQKLKEGRRTYQLTLLQ
jgi:hypothetical protein